MGFYFLSVDSCFAALWQHEQSSRFVIAGIAFAPLYAHLLSV
jgi:hypothetical protein